MAELGLVAKARRKTYATTDSNHDKPAAPNILCRQFDVKYPNTAWVMDITYIGTGKVGFIWRLLSTCIAGW